MIAGRGAKDITTLASDGSIILGVVDILRTFVPLTNLQLFRAFLPLHQLVAEIYASGLSLIWVCAQLCCDLVVACCVGGNDVEFESHGTLLAVRCSVLLCHCVGHLWP